MSIARTGRRRVGGRQAVLSITMQNGHAVATVLAPVSSAWRSARR